MTYELHDSTTTSVRYDVMIAFEPGTYSEWFTNQDGSATRYDLSTMYPRAFASGYRSAEAAADTLERAREYVAGYSPAGAAWLERVTVTTTREVLTEDEHPSDCDGSVTVAEAGFAGQDMTYQCEHPSHARIACAGCGQSIPAGDGMLCGLCEGDPYPQ